MGDDSKEGGRERVISETDLDALVDQRLAERLAREERARLDAQVDANAEKIAALEARDAGQTELLEALASGYKELAEAVELFRSGELDEAVEERIKGLVQSFVDTAVEDIKAQIKAKIRNWWIGAGVPGGFGVAKIIEFFTR